MPRTRTRHKPARWPISKAKTPLECQGLWRGCSLAWPLWDYGERTIFDVSGNQIHGTFGSQLLATDWVSTELGAAADFAVGAGDMITADDPPTNLLDGTAALSVEVMFILDAVPGAGVRKGLCSKYQPTDGYRSWRFIVLEDEIQLQVSSDGVAFEPQQTTDANLAAGTIYQALVTYDAGDFHAYVNGAEKTTDGDFGSQLSIFGGARGLIVGQDTLAGGGSADVLDGKILSVRVWLRALSAAEAVLLWERPFGMYERPTARTYSMEHSGGSGAGAWSLAGEALKGAQQLEVTGLLNGVSYDVQLKTVDTSDNESTGSTIISGTPAATASVARVVREPLVGRAQASRFLRRAR